MRILFWNTHKNKSINPYIASLVYDNDIDVLVLSEYDANVDELNKMFEGNNQRLTKCNTLGCERIDVWTSYANIKSGIQEKYYSIQIINDDFVLCCIHLCTDLYGDHSDERLAIIQRIMYDVQKIEEKIESQRTIVIGDINEMPYGRGCLNANGFHGLPVLDLSLIHIYGNRHCRCCGTAGYLESESTGRKTTDGTNAKGKYLREISMGCEKERDGESAA